MKYGKLNEVKTEIIDEYQIIDGKTPWLGNISNPSHEQWLAAGWLLFVNPVVGKYQFPSDVDELDIVGGTYTKRVETQTDEDIRLQLIDQTETKSDADVEVIAPSRKVARYNSKGAKLNRQAIKHLESPADNPKLTPEEEATADALEAMQEATEPIREAEDEIVEEINEAAGQVLIDFDVENHPAWP